ncbi:RimK-like protein [Bradyrhizobium liaoningense]|uniref:ATP-grasp domain-containing protein n=1 Tax=Bradyrhizobium liaoningense TaxID=43992 RepID=UPI001BAC8363|nr:RimK-like protein [Bradyrhizobium liaoningense]
MPERIFVQAIRHYCARHDIDIDVRADGWLIAMRRGPQRHFAFGYDIGLNSAIAHRLANDKSAAAEVLALSGVPCIPHRLFIDPKLVPAPGAEEMMRALLADNQQGLVLKPNEGTAGRLVIRVTNARELQLAVEKIFTSSQALVISPFVDIEEEVRVILLEETPMVVYRKERPSVTGDGTHTLRELARATALEARLGDVAPDALDAIVPAGERRILNWRHNLDAGARPVLIEDGDVRTACVAIAIAAARAIGIRFASIDIVRTGGAWKVLEINSGVMMEALGKLYPELAHATYGAALDRVFEDNTASR